MGTSTDGQICYGVSFEEDYEFPWNSDEDSDIEEWWMSVNDFKVTKDIWTPEGEYADGITKEDKDNYYSECDEWKKANPIPIYEVNVCSGDCPMIILATPSSVMKASRGDPLAFDPKNLVVDEREEQNLKDFCAKYELDNSGLKWWLSSYWG